ncbi:ABC transporter permease [Pseudalkalibacillus salsuginis]|uniref:ABC transporter permease n=1 Tax=Pseudalkalibacillus salsuginis TaxID=2910972 RepID=UPI001F193984|nr:ABC transporter permease subunit [Pseudalkalibacillus salsuginis]MCF6409983.1 ABC transporter permease subunit [Pseudalkalibacillus salsuginis]
MKIGKKIWKQRFLFLLLLPGLVYFIVYKYIPMFGLVIAFKDYNPFQGIWESEWVGLKHFKNIFATPDVLQVIWNTLNISFLQILFAFPVPIILALMLNELRGNFYKRIIQSIIYLPHFLSWVIVVGITVVFLRSEGLINAFLHSTFGWEAIPFLTDPAYFKPLIILQVIWKESGWGTIIFLAALSGINPQLYEAAIIDGANRWRQIWHITLPALKSTIVILVILRLGNVLDTGFEQIFLMLNPFNMEIGNVLDTFVFFKGIQQADYSFATAVGLFKGAVGLILVVLANRLARRFGNEGLY